MQSNIINMAERVKDDTDRLLESMFRDDPVADAGFSARVVGRVKRRMRARRLALAGAAVFGIAIAGKPLVDLLRLMPEIVRPVLSALPAVDVLATVDVPELSTVIVGTMLLGGLLMIGQLLED